MLSGGRVLIGCGTAPGLVFLIGRMMSLPVWLLAAEVFATILGLFLFGSFRYQIHKNALTYGMLMIITATFCGLRTSEWHAQIAEQGGWWWIQANLLSFHG